MSTHNKYINRKKIVTRPRNRMGGENFKKATIATITIIIAAMIITSGAWLSNGHLAPSGGSPQVIATLVGNASNPHPYYNTTNGYVSPNLWNLQKGNGNVTMQIYSNSSIHTVSNLSNVSIGYGGVIGYPSEHLTNIVGTSVQNIENKNFSSFTSFDVLYRTPNSPVDVTYDIFLGNGSTLTDEIMIYLYLDDYNLGLLTFDNVYIPTLINGHLQNISWNVYESTSTPWWGQMYAFVPNVHFNSSMSYKVNFVPFLKYLEVNKYITPNLTIVRCGIGSEFGSQLTLLNNHVENLADYSFWMYAYFILNGTKCQVVQPSGGS